MPPFDSTNSRPRKMILAELPDFVGGVTRENSGPIVTEPMNGIADTNETLNL